MAEACNGHSGGAGTGPGVREKQRGQTPGTGRQLRHGRNGREDSTSPPPASWARPRGTGHRAWSGNRGHHRSAGPPRWPGRLARSRGPAMRPRQTLACSSRPALASPSSTAPEWGLALPFPGAEALAPWARPGRPVSLSCPRGSAEARGLHGPLGHGLHDRKARVRAPGHRPPRSHSGTGHRPPPGSPGRSYQEGCLPVGIGPADLVTCPQGSTETLRVAAGSPRGGRCSSRARLHLWLREDQASLTLSHCVSGRVGRGCGGPTCPLAVALSPPGDDLFAPRGGRGPLPEQPLMSPGRGAGAQPSLLLWASGRGDRLGDRASGGRLASLPPQGGRAPGCLQRAQGQLP